MNFKSDKRYSKYLMTAKKQIKNNTLSTINNVGITIDTLIVKKFSKDTVMP